MYRLIADTIPHMVWTARADGALDYFNSRVLEYTGLSSRALEGWSWKAVVHPDEIERCVAAWTRALQTGERYELEFRLHRADGAYRWHHASAVPLRDALGRIQRWFGTCVDIESDVRSAQILENMVDQSEQRFRSFMDHAPAIAWAKDASLRYTYASASYGRVYNRDPAEIIGRSDFELWAEPVARLLRSSDEAALRDRAVQRVEGVPGPDGRPAHWLVAKFVLPDAEGKPGVGGIAIDVTARMAAEEQARAYAEEARELMDQLVVAQESERRRVADELHDLIGQNLTALGIDLAALSQRIGAGNAAGPGARLDAMRTLLEETMGAIRGVMSALRPPDLEEYGLVAALRWNTEEFSRRTGMKAVLEVAGEERRLASDAELALFRIVQEAMVNAAKHSGGSALRIAIEHGPDLIRVAVEDDGQGFANPVGARRSRVGGSGLRIMRERAASHGGTLRVEFPGRGTRVAAELPFGHGGAPK